MQRIPFFNYRQHTAMDREEIMRLITDVLDRGAFILQQDLEEFESNLAKYLGAAHAVGVGNCTDGLTLALMSAGIERGDEVILPSHTFVATAEAVHALGAVPVPVECGADHLIDPQAVEAAVTKKTRALMPVQLNGRTCRMDALQSIAQKNNLLLIEDAAQSLGAKYKGRMAGTFGIAAALSFYPAKILGCFGDGGAVITNDDQVAEKVRLLRDHGRNAVGKIVAWGVNSRLDNLQAAILNYKFRSYEETIGRRRQIAARYDHNLRDVSALVLPPPPDSDPDYFDVFQNYEIEAERRDELSAFLKERGIGTLIQWGGQPIHQLAKLGFTQRLPFTDRVFSRCLLLPINPFLSNDDVDSVCEHIQEFYADA